ncbi:Aldose 1-epimerase [Phycisphaerales bacterium]|nr:Aldose 1-epimerase [Phycisphaerales bacterium]
MHRLALESDSLRAQVDPRLGAAICDLTIRGPGNQWFPLLRRAPAEASCFNDTACYLLAPWCNRIPAGAFTFHGIARNVNVNWPDNSSIHGDVCGRPWTLLDRSPASAAFELDARSLADRNWPWPYRARVRYETAERTLRCRLELTNESNSRMPAGIGFHPYFVRSLWDTNDRVAVLARNAGKYPLQNLVPIEPAAEDAVSRALAAGTPLDALGELDDVFAGADGRAEITWPASGIRARFECSPIFGHVVIYSPSAPAGGFLPYFCLEPVSMVNNAINLYAQGWHETGLVPLAPGDTLAGAWNLHVEPM